jgi:AraC-like DNA-binding protein
VPIGEVSYLLGYAEPSNFHRAFRRWTGRTPAEWRERG